MKRLFRNCFMLAMGLSFLALSSGSVYAIGWTITDLWLGGANGINNAGQVVGYVNTGAQNSYGSDINHAALWSNGTAANLGTLGGASSYAQGINNLGQIVGSSEVPRPSDDLPFLWASGTMTQLSPYGIGAKALAINDSAQAVGPSIASRYSWSYGVDLQFPANSQPFIFFASDINNNGQVVGTCGGFACGEGAAVLWDNGPATQIDLLTAAFAINDNGQVVGTTATGSAALWSNGTLTEIGPAQSRWGAKVFDINNSGQVVGTGLSLNNSPYLWDNGTTIDLNSLVAGTDWILDYASAINDWGQIVGGGTIGGEKRAFLLSPDSLFPVPIPEPATVLLLGAGLLGLVGIRRRNQQ